MQVAVMQVYLISLVCVVVALAFFVLAFFLLVRYTNENTLPNIEELIEAGNREEAIRRLFMGWGTYWIAPPGSPLKTNQEVSEENRYRMQLLSQHFPDILLESPIVAELIDLENQIQPNFDDVELMERHSLFVRLLSTKGKLSATAAALRSP